MQNKYYSKAVQARSEAPLSCLLMLGKLNYAVRTNHIFNLDFERSPMRG